MTQQHWYPTKKYPMQKPSSNSEMVRMINGIAVTMCTIAFTGCMLPGGGGYGNMLNPAGVSGMGGTSYLGGAAPGGARTGFVGGGGFFNTAGNRIIPGQGGMSGANASGFAQNVIKLEVGKSTTEDAVALVGAPGMKNKSSGIEIWQYPLFTGGMPGLGMLAFNNSGVLKAIKVSKSSMSGGGLNTEEVYSRGNLNMGSL